MAVGIMKDTKSVKKATFGDILIVSFTKVIPFTTVSDTSQLEKLAVTPETNLYKKIEKIFSQDNRIDKVSIIGTDGADAGAIKIALDKMYKTKKGYYFILMDSFDETKSKAVIDWAIAKNKLPVYCTEKEVTMEVIESFFKGLNSKAIAFATKEDDDFPDAKVVGAMATQTPGKDKWEWKEPQGALFSGFDLTDQDTLESLGVNTIQEEREGVLAMFPGKCCNGEFIDIVWGSDNLQDDIEIAFIRAEKKPYKIYHPGIDPRGITQCRAIVEEVLNDYASDFREFIAKDINGKPQFKINVKTEYTENDIAARIFEVSWIAIPSGSASFGKIDGLLTFDKKKIGAV